MKPSVRRAVCYVSVAGSLMTLGLACREVVIADEGEWNAPASSVGTANPLPADDATIAAGRRVYERQCVFCHGKTGRGDGFAAKDMNPAPGDWTDAKRMGAQTDGELFWKIAEGRKPMPSFGARLTEEERWQVIRYLRTFAKRGT